VDALVDRCGALLNLRTEILLYRRPRRSFRFYRRARPGWPRRVVSLATTP